MLIECFRACDWLHRADVRPGTSIRTLDDFMGGRGLFGYTLEMGAHRGLKE